MDYDMEVEYYKWVSVSCFINPHFFFFFFEITIDVPIVILFCSFYRL